MACAVLRLVGIGPDFLTYVGAAEIDSSECCKMSTTEGINHGVVSTCASRNDRRKGTLSVPSTSGDNARWTRSFTKVEGGTSSFWLL
jgi:hypothetical protein